MLVADVAKRCSVLLIDPDDAPLSSHRVTLQELGFRVKLARDWPQEDRAILEYHVVVVRIRDTRRAPMLAARLRAKPRFGRRVLIGLVPESTPVPDRIAARVSGFDDVLTDCCQSRELTGTILRYLRARPEYHCVLPPDDKRPNAA
jgi:DNA-binding response OmpR family regulator